MPDRRLSRVLVVCAAVVLSGTPARAASVDDEARRLDDLAYYVEELGRGFDPLLAEFATTIAGLRDDGSTTEAALRPVLLRRDDIAWRRAESLFETRRTDVEERCLELYRLLAQEAVDDGRRSAAQRRCADVSIRRGERFEAEGDESRALEAYLGAVDYAPEYQLGYEKVGALGVSQADRQTRAQEYDAALETLAQVLTRIERGLPADHPRIAEARGLRETILSTTGTLSLRLLRAASPTELRSPRTDFAEGEVRLVPRDAGVAPPVLSAAAPRRVRATTYDATVTGVGGTATVRAEVTVTRSGAEIAVPAAIPDGMVWVGPGNGVGAFLCDRTEISNAAYAAFARDTRRPLPAGPGDLPAVGVAFDDARACAAWFGKQLPTRDQWVQAALGDPSGRLRPYPWGESPGTPGVHFVGGTSAPGAVDGCADGASYWGALNLARNAWEWVRTDGVAEDKGWFIGGGWSFSTFVMSNLPISQSSDTWELEVLEQPVPSFPTFADEGFADDPKKYKGFIEAVWRANQPQIGLRCVIPLE